MKITSKNFWNFCKATISRKPDFLLGVELKDYLKGDNGSKSIELAYTLLEQTFQGTIPNPQILSYLKYSIRSQLITCSGVFSALTSFKKINQQVLHCLLLIGKLSQKKFWTFFGKLHFQWKIFWTIWSKIDAMIMSKCWQNHSFHWQYGVSILFIK